MPFLTPNSDPETVTCRVLYIPNDPTWIELVSGALLPLLYPFNYEQYGTATPEETAQRFGDMLDDFLVSECAPMPYIAEIRAFAHTNPPAGWLACNGNAVSRSTYAGLFGAIGTTYGEGNGSTSFNVPNLTNRFMKGFDENATAGTENAMGGTGGAVSVTLTTAQIPSHDHNGVVSPNNPVSNRALVSTGGIQTVRSAGTSDTAGGGQSHENRPPFVGVAFMIYSGV